MRVTVPVTMFATAVWLASACGPLAECSRVAKLERRSADGGRKAAVVEVEGDEGSARVGSLVLFAESAADAERLMAAFDRRVEGMEWLGEDLLLGFARDEDVRAFSIFPGIRIRPALSPPGASAGLFWLRLSMRRSRR